MQREKAWKFLKNKISRGILLRETLSVNLSILILNLFFGGPLNGLGHTQKFNRSLEKSGNSSGEWTPCF